MIHIDCSVEDYIDDLVGVRFVVSEPVLQQARLVSAGEFAKFDALVDVKNKRPESEQLVELLHHFALNFPRVREHVIFYLF